MPSTPLICSSIGAATVSAITFGLAPGYCARTTTEGGTTSGYSEIGITRSASRPATKMSTDSTPAKIGRSMKNLDRFMACAPLQGEVKAGEARLLDARRRSLGLHSRNQIHADQLRRDHGARADPLQAVDDDAFTG